MRKQMVINTLHILFLCISYSLSQTSISGDIQGNYTHSASPYFVESDIVIPSGTTCEIDAGVVFLFRPFTGLRVEGTLIVNGTNEQSVVFTSANDTVYNTNSVQPANPFDWNGILVLPESFGSSLKNFSIFYSVYGLKSQTPNITVTRGIFAGNGQFHFTIKDQIQSVQDRIPFSYPTTEAPTETTVEREPEKIFAPPASPSSLPASPPEKGVPVKRLKKTFIRYGSLGIGVIGTAGGVVLLSMAKKNDDAIQSMPPDKINPETGDYYSSDDKVVREENEKFTRNKIGGIAGLILGALGFVGFGVTFFF